MAKEKKKINFLEIAQKGQLIENTGDKELLLKNFSDKSYLTPHITNYTSGAPLIHEFLKKKNLTLSQFLAIDNLTLRDVGFKSSGKKLKKDKLTAEDKEVIQKYWLAGYDAVQISDVIGCLPTLIVKNLKSRNLLISSRFKNKSFIKALSEFSEYMRGTDKFLDPFQVKIDSVYPSLSVLNGNDVLRLESKENVVSFLRNRSNTFKKKNTNEINSLSDDDLLAAYGIDDFTKFKAEAFDFDKKIYDRAREASAKLNLKNRVISGLFILTLLVNVFLIFGSFLVPETIKSLILLTLGLGQTNYGLAVLLLCFSCFGVFFLVFRFYENFYRIYIEGNEPEHIDKKYKLGFEKWSLLKTNRLTLLANNGLELETISRELSGLPGPKEPDLYLLGTNFSEQDIHEKGYSIASVRQKLVQLGLYADYLERNWDYQTTLVEKLSKKLKKDFGSSVEKSWNENLKNPKFIKRLINGHENKMVEFKETFFINQHSGKKDEAITHSAIKTIGGFLNSVGGTLLVGVKDSGGISGIFEDNFKNIDKYKRDIQNIIKESLTVRSVEHIIIEITKIGSENVCAIRVDPSRSPIWCNHSQYNKLKGYDQKHEFFYVRTNAETISYPPSQQPDYIRDHFNE